MRRGYDEVKEKQPLETDQWGGRERRNLGESMEMYKAVLGRNGCRIDPLV